MPVIAICCILSAILGFVAALWTAWRFIKGVFNHAAHCRVCKLPIINALNSHEDTGTECIWKRLHPVLTRKIQAE